MTEYVVTMQDTSDIHKPITFQVIDNLDAWKQSKSEWNELVHKSSAPSVFLTFEYLQSAWEAYGQDAVPHIVRFSAGETLWGIVPLKISSRRVCGITTTTLQPIGGEEAEGNYFIVLHEEDKFYEEFSNYLSTHSHLWSKVFFHLLNSAHPFTTLFNTQFSTNRKVLFEQHICFNHPFLTINQSWEHYFAQLNQKFTHNLRTKVSKTCNAGKLQVVRFCSPADIAEYLDLYVALEHRSWKTAHSSGITRTASLHTLYKNMLNRCAQKGWAELTFLLLDDRLLAGGIGMRYADKYTYLQTVYDTSASHLSPGMILMTINVWRMHQAGLQLVDFMGNYVEYKRNWATDEWQSCTVCVRKRYSGEGLAYLGARWIKPVTAWLLSKLTAPKAASRPDQPISPLTMDIHLLTKQQIILTTDDIYPIFQLKRKQQSEQQPTQEIATSRMTDTEVDQLVAERTQARNRKDWHHADAIRDLLLNNGVILRDKPLSTEWSRASHGT